MTTWTNEDTARSTTIDRDGRVFGTSICSFIRPANTTAYARYDLVGAGDGGATGVSGAGVFPACATANGGSGSIRKATLTITNNTTDSQGNPPSFVLHIFDEEPTNRADNAAVNLTDADLPTLITSIEFSNATALVVNDGTSPAGALHYEVDIPSFHASYVCEASADDLYGFLVLDSTAWTPASEDKFIIRLHLDMDITGS